MFVNNTCLKYLNSDTSQACADRAYLFLRSSSKQQGMAGTGFLLDCGLGSRRARAFYRAPGRRGEPPGPVSGSQWLPPPSGQEMRAE